MTEHDRTGQRDYKSNESAVWVGEPACNQRPWQRAAICVEKNMERIGRDGRFARFADDIHFSDIPNLAFWHDEIVSSKAVIIVEFGLVVLRCDDPIGRRGWWRGRRVVRLIVEDDSRCGRDWRNNRYGNRGCGSCI